LAGGNNLHGGGLFLLEHQRNIKRETNCYTYVVPAQRHPGVPIIRTSVDHGTAYDLAGTGRATPDSLKAAIKMAAAMARRRSSAG
jgi:hypothetical protein